MSKTDTEQDLRERVDELEAQLENHQRLLAKLLPSRRDALKLGATGLAGLLAGSAATGSGAAADTSVGEVGAVDNSVDIYLDELLDPQGDAVADVDDTGDIVWQRGQQFPAVDVSSLSVGSNQVLLSRAASGQVSLSSGSAVVDTGLSATDATFYLALGIDDPNADAKVSGRLFWDDSAGTYHVEVVESGTSVGNPTVNYDILRVR